MGKIRCCKCAKLYEYTESEAWWDYKGADYDAKLVKCKDCGAITVIKYVEMPNRYDWDIREIKI